jgi:hypothetical protein
MLEVGDSIKENAMSNTDTRLIKISVEDLKIINTLIMIHPPEVIEKIDREGLILGMLLQAVNESDSETLNDFTA